jgi:hypothetical protein
MTTPPHVQPSRPGNVTAAAVILFVGAGLGLLACCGFSYLSAEANLSEAEQNAVTIVSGLLAVGSVVNVVLGYFLLRGRRWARIVTIGYVLLSLAGRVVTLFTSAEAAGGLGAGVCLGIVLDAIIIGLLSGSAASDYFRHHVAGE